MSPQKKGTRKIASRRFLFFVFLYAGTASTITVPGAQCS